MELIGKWKVAKTLYIDPLSFEKSWESPSELTETGKIDAEYASILNVIYEFCEDGSVKAAMPFPEGVSKEEIDAAIQAGEAQLYGDDMLLLETKQWKEENGKFFYDSGAKGTVFDEEISPWVEIEVLSDGMIELLTNRLEKL